MTPYLTSFHTQTEITYSTHITPYIRPSRYRLHTPWQEVEIMATLHAQRPTVVPTTFSSVADTSVKRRDVDTVLNYFKPNEDGSPPQPTYVDRPETYERPADTHPVRITDISGSEAEYTLDKQGFQVVHHTAQEKDFTDDAHIKAVYYPETEQLLKDV